MLELHLLIDNGQEEEIDALEGIMESVQDWLAKMRKDGDETEQPKGTPIDDPNETEQPEEATESEEEQPKCVPTEEPPVTYFPTIDDAEIGTETEEPREATVQHLTKQQERELLDFLRVRGIEIVEETDNEIVLNTSSLYVGTRIRQIAPQLSVHRDGEQTVVSLPVA